MDIIFLFPIVVAHLTSLFLMAYLLYEMILNKKRTLLVKTFFIVIVLSGIWTFAYLLQNTGLNEKYTESLKNIEYFSLSFIGMAWLSLSLIYIKRIDLLKKIFPITVTLSVISYLMVLTNDYHGLVFTELNPENVELGILWWIFILSLNYAYIAVGIIIYTHRYLKLKDKIEKRRTLILIFASLFPLIGNIIHIFISRPGIFEIPYDLSSILFSFSNVLFFIGFFRYGLFNITSYITEGLMSNIKSGIMVLDLNCNIVEVNAELLRMLGGNKADLLNNNINEINLPLLKSSRKKIELLIENTAKNPERHYKDYICFSNPHEKYFSASCSSIKDEYKDVLGTVLVMEDITDSYKYQKKIEEYNGLLSKEKESLLRLTDDLEASRKSLMNITKNLKSAKDKLSIANKKLKKTDKMRKEFVSLTAHELVTPLNIFRWTVEMLKNEDVGVINRNQRELLENVSEANKRLLILVDNLLEISRIDQGRFKIKISKCNLSELISRVLGEMAIKIRQKKLKIEWERPNNKMLMIKADCSRITQVLANIIDNSVKYTPNNGVIKINTNITNEIRPGGVAEKHSYIQKNKRYVLCSISDTGIGVPKKEQKKMFSRFFRASNAVKTEEEGTGLGMTIAKNIVDMHDGAIWFKSEKNKGMTISFTIPAVIDEAFGGGQRND